MPMKNEHSARIHPPGRYEKFRRQNDKGGQGVDFIFGITEDGTAELQAVRFDKKRFSPEQVKGWLKDHDMKSIELEPAQEVTENRASFTLEHVLTENLATATVKPRYEELDGRRYMVVPMVMLTEGVHQGSQGPLYYPPEELGKTPGVWNTKPIVVYHPKINGLGVSACSPEILSSRSVGMVMHSRFEDGKLKAEAWLDDEKMDRVDHRIREFITANRPMEISTGLFTDNIPSLGTWNGEAYQFIAKNYRPDHLALLPDERGACSLEDGAGLLRNQADEDEPTRASRLEPVQNAKGYKSHNQLRQALQKKLQDRFGRDNIVEDVYDRFFVYYNPQSEKLFRLSYESVDGGCRLGTDSPQDVMRVIEYQTVAGDYVANATIPLINGDSVMKREDMVDALIANEATAWDEDDREFLLDPEQFDDTVLNKVYGSMGKKAQTPMEEEEDDDEPAPKPTRNQGIDMEEIRKQITEEVLRNQQSNTPEEFIAKAPPGFRPVLQNGLDAYKAQCAALVEEIVGNAEGEARDDLLAHLEDVARKDNGLRLLQNMAGRVQANKPKKEAAAQPSWFGAATPPPTNNSEHKQEGLKLPTMNFETADA